ncbi:hypothetical protein L4D21_05360 [Photobacterium profundum]|uniref:hypothetical protein n=1 Tax=Photobacterium profundum TaxID=74109 RepID=UPI003D0D1342
MTITLTLASDWDKNVLNFLHKVVIDSEHPFVMLTVQPGDKVLSLISSIGTKSNIQLHYVWRLLGPPMLQVLHYKVKASGLSNILKKLQYGLPVQMTIEDGKIYIKSLQPKKQPDLFDHYLADDSGYKYWLEILSDEYSREFEMYQVDKTLSVRLAAAVFGEHLERVGKYIKHSPLNIGDVPNLHLNFTQEQVSIQGQVSGDAVSIIQPCRIDACLLSERFFSPTIALSYEQAMKLEPLLQLCPGNITVSLLENAILIERPDWALLLNLARPTIDGQAFEKRIDAIFSEAGCALQAPILLNTLEDIAIADRVEKELVHVVAFSHSHPNFHDEFRLGMNQDGAGALFPIKMAHPLTADLKICCNLVNFKLVLESLPSQSRWIFLPAQQALLFYDDIKAMRFVMACRQSCLSY